MSLSENFKARLARIVKNNPKGRPMEGSQYFPDPTPVAPPIGYKKQPSMVDIIREQIRLAGEASKSQGFETFEEADDFDVDDDYDPRSPYELIVEQARPDGPVTRPDPGPEPQPAPPAPPNPPGAAPAPEAPAKAPGAPGGG